MRSRFFATVYVLAATLGQAHAQPGSESFKLIEEAVRKEYASLESIYKHLHAHPELALHEERTSERIAKELAAAGFTVTRKVGGHGVVGVFKNGKGPTVLVRADMDALPIEEKTGLPYASKEVARSGERTVGVMHACG